jgi:hypothetical protein
VLPRPSDARTPETCVIQRSRHRLLTCKYANNSLSSSAFSRNAACQSHSVQRTLVRQRLTHLQHRDALVVNSARRRPPVRAHKLLLKRGERQPRVDVVRVRAQVLVVLFGASEHHLAQRLARSLVVRVCRRECHRRAARRRARLGQRHVRQQRRRRAQYAAVARVPHAPQLGALIALQARGAVVSRSDRRRVVRRARVDDHVLAVYCAQRVIGRQPQRAARRHVVARNVGAMWTAKLHVVEVARHIGEVSWCRH